MTQFYQLTLSEVINLYQEGKITTFCALEFYIKIKFAPGWKIVLDRSEIMEIFDLTIHQFRRAVTKLKGKLTIFIKSVKQVATAAVKKVTPSVNNVTLTEKKVTPSANCDRQTTNKINTSEDLPDIRSNINHISLLDKPKLSALSKEEREKFLNFGMDKVNELPKRPTLPSKWIAANFDDLYSEFKLSSAPETQQATKEKQFDEWYDLMRQLGHAVGKKVKDGVQMVEGTGGYWSTYEEKSKFWKLDYLRKAVRGK